MEVLFRNCKPHRNKERPEPIIMTALFKQPEWSIEEVVLLALASEDVSAMRTDIEDAAEQLSNRLRCGAEMMGISISSRYRSVEEVKNKIKLITSMIKTVGNIENEYLEGTTIGHIALLSKNNREQFNQLTDSANELFPKIETSAKVTESKEFYYPGLDTQSIDKVAIVSEPETALKTLKKKRPRISITRSDNDHVYTSYNSTSQLSGITTDSDTERESCSQTEIELSTKDQQTISEPIQENSYQKYLGLVKVVLIQYFQRGFRQSSAIDLKRFRAYYKDIHGKAIPLSDDILCSYIRDAGFEYDGKIYVSDKVVSCQIAEDIKQYIKSSFSEGREYLHYKTIFSHFEDSLLDSQIVNAEMLKQYLKNSFAENYYFTNTYVAIDSFVRVSVHDEVNTFVRSQHRVVTLELLKNALDFLPEEEVAHEWCFNDGSLITNGKNEKFHIDTFEITANQKECISKFIAEALQNNPFVAGHTLVDELRINQPELFANNNEISSIGIRNALAYHLKKRFSFRNNIISNLSDSYDGVTAMLAFCKKLGYFTISEAEGMSEVIGTGLFAYLERISEVAIRINDNDFVPSGTIKFDVEAIDKALDIYVKGEYLPIIEIENFEVFPSCGEYPWNLRLLESYLLTESSSRYKYYHGTFLGKYSMTGAIVKKDSKLKTYEDILIQSLGESEIDLDEDKCNEYLYRKGLIARRQKNGSVKKLLMKAKECRNRLNKQKHEQP